MTPFALSIQLPLPALRLFCFILFHFVERLSSECSRLTFLLLEKERIAISCFFLSKDTHRVVSAPQAPQLTMGGSKLYCVTSGTYYYIHLRIVKSLSILFIVQSDVLHKLSAERLSIYHNE